MFGKLAYEKPEIVELGAAEVLTLGTTGCNTDCDECDLPRGSEEVLSGSSV